MQTIDASIAFTPNSEALRFLPEGPYRCPDGRISWVAIQKGINETTGALNLLDLGSGANETYPLRGRPGFAFPTETAGKFLIGLERSIVLYDTASDTYETVVDGVDSDVEGTIINDGVIFDGHLVFGCKELTFSEKKAGLYLLRKGESQLVRLANDQICSNGKAVIKQADGTYLLFDIDTPSQQVIGWDLDLAAGKITNPRTVVDLTKEPVFPDGMLMTPDSKSLIVAFYDPRDSEYGEARQFDIASGELQTIWRCEQSPRVTCPQLVEHQGRVQLLLTTADEGMSSEQRAKSPNAGCLFVGETSFEALNDAPLSDAK